MTRLLSHVILHNMFGGEANSPPVRLLVNYWEMRPSKMPKVLGRLRQNGVTEVTSFIPWQAFESDISHKLRKFLTAAVECRIRVSLIVSPEVGLNFPLSGLPKDLVADSESVAQDVHGNEIRYGLPPNLFPMPSLVSHKFSKRYFGYLAKLNGFFCDVVKNDPDARKNTSLVLSGSFWKYYRSSVLSSGKPFGGRAGERSHVSEVEFQKTLGDFFSQSEFSEEKNSERWKAHSYDEVNRRWFNQHVEEVFRSRSAQTLFKRGLDYDLRHLEITTPEADPAYYYSNLLQSLTGGCKDVFRLSDLLDQYYVRKTNVDEQSCEPYVHWTQLGGFGRLNESEKQFLFLKSLILMGARGGGVLISCDQWFRFSKVFRKRVEALGQSLTCRDFAFRPKVTYLNSHSWSGAGPLWEEVFKRVGNRALMASSSHHCSKNTVVDPSVFITYENLKTLLDRLVEGGVLVLPRSPLFSPKSSSFLKEVCEKSESIEMNFGVKFKLCGIGAGQLVLYELPEGVTDKAELQNAWARFSESVVGLLDGKSSCQVSDGRLRTMTLDLGSDVSQSEEALFVFNQTGRMISASLVFSETAQISDLTFVDSGTRSSKGRSFQLDVPPYGVLPIRVTYPDRRKFRIASKSNPSLQESRV